MSENSDQIKIKIPPIVEDLGEHLKDYLLKPERLNIHSWERSQKHWPRDVDIDSLLHCPRIPPQTTLKVERNLTTGVITGLKEVTINQNVKPGDLSMDRPPLPPELATRGSNMQLPFWPGGFEEEQAALEKKFEDDLNIGSGDGKFFGEELLFLPPGFTEGVLFAEDGCTPLLNQKDGDLSAAVSKEFHLIDINEDLDKVIEEEQHLIGLWSEPNEPDTNEKQQKSLKRSYHQSDNNDYEDILDSNSNEEQLPMPELPVLNITKTHNKLGVTSTEWAEMIDVSQPVENFYEKIPHLAHVYPFELDTFQKQAILKLEEGHHVLVAAHTSAGKTVVAEYAIALSQKHCTRTVYTSPIKALSNQKYNDFLKTFGDVGLLTGDIQINPTASCLVMTTEILRSMLYCGSDVARDLEFVIFDEVHYINNAERGHVWEEVLILLPAHVGIVLLSATVPNTLQFADWVGRIKKRKVYVVSTLKRPVPLCHYLYTGTGGKSKNERFKVVDQDGQFLLRGYNEAVAAKKSRENDYKKSFGPKGGKMFLNPKQEQTMWVALVDHLRSNDKLPVVAFTLNRNRCDQNADALMSVDLTTAKEKSHIHSFFQRCLNRLKEPDRKLPQVMRLYGVLMNGVGVHHSGILPLLKEIVELLFQSGFVKILFATETFAMGVNMPARTVVFDGITKFDGLETRMLAPDEYIQMAGRAGRRGLDDTGTVIILCKENIPDQMQLKEMMLGTPKRLSSQFRLTYSMILSLLRVATVSVEGMMQRSFGEFDQQCKADSYKRMLEEAEKECSDICSVPLASHLNALSEFYDTAIAYIEESADLMPVLVEQAKVAKELVAGKVLVVSVGPYINQLAILLNNKGPRTTPYKILILETSKPHIVEKNKFRFEVNDIWYRMLSLTVHHDRIGTEVPVQVKNIMHAIGIPAEDHTILCIGSRHILQVTKLTLKVDVTTVISDWEKRQMPRFKDAPVGSTCAQVVQELSRLSHSVFTGATQLEFISLTQSLSIKTGEILQSLDRVERLKAELANKKKSTDIANFTSEFAVVYERKQAERKRDKLKRLLSYENMALYPEYLRRLRVLSELRYIDSQHRVAMKGRVACEMGTSELMVTELVFRNVLTDLQPCEIAALLSCLVFQARTNISHELTDRLKQGIAALEAIDDDVRAVESKYLVTNFEADRLNFGLVKVVYEWAKEKPFAEIMELTDVQEGIIVRCIQQLNEVLMDLRDAAKIIGDPTLQTKMQEASTAIKRDIVFAASLYTSQKETG